MTNYPFDSETINTASGRYVLDLYTDENADQPYNESFTLITNGEANYGYYAKINIRTGEADTPLGHVISQALSNSFHQWDHVSGAALVRYLRLQGRRGVTLVDDEYDPVEATTDRSERIYGVAWSPDDATEPDTYTRSSLAEWSAWARGDVFGWKLLDPSGDEVDSCWGHFDVPGERQYVLEQATEAARDDAQERLNNANLAGAGIVGIV